MGEAAGVEVGARFERLNPSGLTFEVFVGAVEEKGNEWADLVAERRLGGGESGMGDEFVMLCYLQSTVCSAKEVPGMLSIVSGPDAYPNCFEDRAQPGEILNAGAKSCN